ncbi:hypothetical protein [Prevotella sp.]|uniref:hypothetical protein n=1 Tax=Prevotella sp. TaxID=59823 RepID=UPI0025ED7AAC|nr:hypothetical protein [Prevotella sp.]
MSFSPHKPFEQEGQEVGEGIELAVLHNTLSQNSKGKRLENHKIPYVFVVKITKFLVLEALLSQNSEIIGQKKATAFTGDRFKSSIGISLSLR